MKLVTVENFELKVADEALLVKPIRRLWNADRSGKKEVFYQQMSYLFFMTDPRSNYSYLVEEEDRHKAIVEQEGLPLYFKPSDLLVSAMEVYQKLVITSSTKLLESTRVAVDALSEELKSTKERLSERTDKGAAVFKANDIMGSLEKVLKFIPQLQDLERKVASEIQDNTKARGGQKALFEDGIDGFMNQ